MNPLLLFIAGSATGLLAQRPIKNGLRKVARGGISVTRSVKKVYSEITEDIEDVAAEMDEEEREELAEREKRVAERAEERRKERAARAAAAATPPASAKGTATP